jgi:hypothetical protein
MRVALLAALALTSGWSPDRQDDVVKKIVPDAEKVRKVQKKLSPQAREKIEKALGEKLADAELTLPLYECYSTVPAVSSMEKTRCLVCIVTVKGAKGPIRLGVAVATLESTLHAVRILENGDDKGIESKHFLAQFDGLEYTPNLYNPPGELASNLKKAQGSDDAAKELDALIRTNSLMRAMGVSWNRMLEKIDKKDKSAADDALAVDKAFEESLRVLPNAKFLKPTQHDRFKQYATGARTDLGQIKDMVQGGKFDDAYRKTGEIDSQRCAKCHGSYRRAFREARFEKNVGNGYFSTKLEVAVPDPKLEASYQAVATGIRKAILLAAEMK